MTNLLAATPFMLKDRDFFIHDGSKLRRFRLSAPVQMLFLALTAALVLWSVYATTRFLTAQPVTVAVPTQRADIAALAAETERLVQEIEQRQLALAAALEGEDVDPESLRRLGFYPSDADARGGPFDGDKGDATFKQLFMNWKKLDNIQQGAIAVPSEKPVKTAAFTSGYGVRSDPFQGRSAMHAGIDLAGPTGTPIYATADGVVTDAGYNSGGYGNLIKIDHGRGIETRYAHLSKMSVRTGQRIKRGDLIGRMGSTGRSTGSHLHYEVRVDGKAVNPIPFMRSTDYLLAMQKKVGHGPAMDAVALGGPKGGAKR